MKKKTNITSLQECKFSHRKWTKLIFCILKFLILLLIWHSYPDLISQARSSKENLCGLLQQTITSLTAVHLFNRQHQRIEGKHFIVSPIGNCINQIELTEMQAHQLKTVRQSCQQAELLSSLACTQRCHRNDNSTSSRISCGNLDEEVSVALQIAGSCK